MTEISFYERKTLSYPFQAVFCAATTRPLNYELFLMPNKSKSPLYMHIRVHIFICTTSNENNFIVYYRVFLLFFIYISFFCFAGLSNSFFIFYLHLSFFIFLSSSIFFLLNSYRIGSEVHWDGVISRPPRGQAPIDLVITIWR